MNTMGIRNIRENPGELTRLAEAGQITLITNHSTPVSVNIPFTQELLEQGVHVNMAAKLFEDGVLTLAAAAKIAQMPIETFLEKISILGVITVDYDEGELDEELAWLKDKGK